MPALATTRSATARQQTPDQLPAQSLQALPELGGALDPLAMLQLQGVMGNGALAGMMAGQQGQADPDAAFDAGEQGQRTELPNRAKIEASLGADFSDVDVIRGPEADQALEGMNARSAYRDGVILLGSSAGPEEAAHEAIHHQQEQSAGGPGGQQVDSGAGQSAEGEAHDLVSQVLAGEPVEVQQSTDAGIQRWGLGDLWEGTKALGSGIVNTAGSAINGVVDTVSTAGSAVVNTVSTAGGGLLDTLGAAGGGVLDTLGAAGGGLLDTLGAAGGGLWDTAMSAGGGVLDTLGAAGGGVLDTLGAAGGGILDTLGAMGGGIADSASAAWGGLSNVWDARGDGIGAMLGAAGSGVMDTLGAMGGGVMDTLGAAGGGIWDTLGAAGGGIWDTLGAAGGGVLDTLGSAGGGILDTLGAAGGGIWDTLGAAGGGIWDTLKAGGGALWDTGGAALGGILDTSDAAFEALTRTGGSAVAGLYNSLKGFLPDSWFDALDGWVQNAGGEVDSADSDERFYSTAPRSTVDNKYTGGMDIPQNLTGMNEGSGPEEASRFQQQFSPLGLPLTQEAWDYQNRIDGGKLQTVHHNTLLGTLRSEGVLDELVNSGEFEEDELTQDFTQMSAEDLHELVIRVDNAGATQTFFADMDPATWTNMQESVLDTYIEMANSDPENSVIFLDMLPTELDIGLAPSELMQDGGPNDFRAGETVSLLREGTATVAEDETFAGMDRYGLVVPFSNTPENVVRNDGIPVDGTEHLSNYLSQIDPNTTTMANSYSQSATATLNYAQQYGGTQGLDYIVATAAMGGADLAGADGVHAGSISTGEDDPGVQALSIVHEDDPARHIQEEDMGYAGFWAGMLNFSFLDWVGDGSLHGGFPDEANKDPQNGTNGYPMDNVKVPWLERMLNGDFQGEEYQRRDDWSGYDRREMEAS